MLFSLGPRDGNYFNPKCFWWWYNTWCCTGAVRVWNVARIVLWVLGRLVDLVLTLLNETLLPLVRILFVTAVAFVNFMLGLLVGEIRMELSIFFPLFMFVLTWILWLFWPQVGCFLENTFWPFFLGLLEFVGLAVRILVTLINTLIRLWNAMVPVIGFILYVVVEVLVMVSVFFVEILGEFDVWGLVNSLFEALFELVNLAIEVIIAFVTISPTFLRIFATAVGSMLSTWLEAAPICIDITFFVTFSFSFSFSFCKSKCVYFTIHISIAISIY